MGSDVNLLIMDGGSRQETIRVGNEFVQGANDLLISMRDHGPYDAMNRAIKLVGDDDLVWFVNAGDYLLDPTVVPDVLQWTSRDEFVWGYGPVVVVDGGRKRKVPKQWPYTLFNHAIGRTPICHQTVVARASALKAVGCFDLRFPIAADFKLLLRLGKSWAPQTWPRPIVAYSSGGLSDRRIFDARREQLLIREEEVVLDATEARLALVTDRLRLGRLVLGKGLDWCAARGLVPRDWRHQASAMTTWLGVRHRPP